MCRVSGKVVLVTGAASGLGKADAIMLAQEGAQVVLTDINEAGEEVASHIVTDLGAEAVFMKQDVTDEQGWVDTIAVLCQRRAGAHNQENHGEKCSCFVHRILG